MHRKCAVKGVMIIELVYDGVLVTAAQCTMKECTPTQGWDKGKNWERRKNWKIRKEGWKLTRACSNEIFTVVMSLSQIELSSLTHSQEEKNEERIGG